MSYQWRQVYLPKKYLSLKSMLSGLKTPLTILLNGKSGESITFEDQIFITLMKMQQNYTNLHLAHLFQCIVATIFNIVITFIHVLHGILFEDDLKTLFHLFYVAMLMFCFSCVLHLSICNFL